VPGTWQRHPASTPHPHPHPHPASPGEELLPEEDPALFKPIPEPSQLDNFLILNQIANYTDQVNTAAGQSLQKLYAMEGLQRALV
jgi:translation initiation factor 3 subunit H